MRQRLILAPPHDVTPGALEAALGGGDVAAVVVPIAAARPAVLVEVSQSEGTAALLGYHLRVEDKLPWPLAFGADGVHVAGAYSRRYATVDTRPEGATLGATAATRHEAMMLGETGSDYIWFGRQDALDEDDLELAVWWQVLFEVPAVLAGPSDASSIGRMIATRVEFIAVNVFSTSEDPGDAVARINALIGDGLVAS